jgi:uncharacterized membrane protein YkoI
VAVAAGAIGGDDPVSGPEAERATEAALAATGGGTANSVERDNENGAMWEVEVTKPDGTTVDVRLDESLEVVVIEGDDEEPNSDDGRDEDSLVDELRDEPDDGRDDSDADDADDHVTGPQADRVADAAVAATGGGTATSVDRDLEDGATWEVEVTKPDGTTVDVLLDANLDVVSVGAEEDRDSGDVDD